ncbi:MAG: hypothetical protein SVR94_07350 [Pseudomonadota bacterium]|nr:hypothetical protein [Pseudomonadota bacterium]
MFKTIDAQGNIHWQEQPPIEGDCRVLITLLDEPVLHKEDKQTAFLQFLLDSPEMDDSEYQAIQEKRQHLNHVCGYQRAYCP